MNKYALFVFNGDPMCFIHVLLNPPPSGRI